MSDFSVVIPVKNSTRVRATFESLLRSMADSRLEVVLVDSSESPVDPRHLPLGSIELVHIPIDVNQMHAEFIGVNAASGSHVLLLDSDQSVERGLIPELTRCEAKLAVVPERSDTSTILGRLLESKSRFYEGCFRLTPSVYIPVIPRFYERRSLLAAFSRMQLEMPDTRTWKVTHSDSVLFYYYIKANHSDLAMDLRFTESCLFHSPPTPRELLRKSFNYGRGRGAFERGAIAGYPGVPMDVARLVSLIDKGRILWKKSVGINFGGVLYDGLRAVPYFAGYAVGSANSATND